MILKINGRIVDDQQKETIKVKTETFSWEPDTCSHWAPVEEPKVVTLREKLGKVRESIQRNFKPVFAGANLLAAVPVQSFAGQYSIAAATSTAAPVAASSFSGLGIGNALAPIVAMLQELALPVGICMAIWGLIEVIIGNYGGKEKIKWALLGYVGVYLIPFAFFQIKNSFGLLPLG